MTKKDYEKLARVLRDGRIRAGAFDNGAAASAALTVVNQIESAIIVVLASDNARCSSMSAMW